MHRIWVNRVLFVMHMTESPSGLLLEACVESESTLT